MDSVRLIAVLIFYDYCYDYFYGLYDLSGLTIGIRERSRRRRASEYECE